MPYSLPQRPELRPLLIAFTDLEGFKQISAKLHDPAAIFQLIDQVNQILAREVSAANGYFVKSMGDGSMLVFDAADSDAGVRSLLAAKASVESCLASQGLSHKMRLSAHVGEAVIGPSQPHGHIDLMGEDVNRAALLGGGSYRGELIISPEAFRKLSPQTRKAFHRHIRETVYRSESYTDSCNYLT